MAVTQTQIDEARLNSVLGKAVSDWGSVGSTALALIGDKLGLYRAMAGAGAITPAELAQQSGTAERYVRDWLVNQAAGGYVEYDPETGRYTLPDEHALVLADESSPFFVLGGFQVMTALLKAEPRIAEVFRTGEGMGWGEHDPMLFDGTERLFRPGYVRDLVSSWIPALDGVDEKLTDGATVADIGCGYGASTIILAEAYPRSRFFGFDSHGPSIERARKSADAAGVANRITFETAAADEYPSTGYDLIAYFDCLHDMSDPVGAARYARRALAPDGTILVVEPMAGDRVEENFNPVGRVFSAASVLVCTPNALVGSDHALGTIATEAQLRDVFEQAGFTRFRRATQTPFNRIFEARP